MRRIMLLGLLALALPTATLATNINFNDPPLISHVFFSGTFNGGDSRVTGLASGGWPAGRTPLFVLFGRDGTPSPGNGTNRFRLTAGALGSGCQAGGSGTCTFTGGTIEVFFPQGDHGLVFDDSLASGTITKSGADVTLTASLLPSSTAPHGGFVKYVIDLNPACANGTGMCGIVGGTARVGVVPEPGTLGMLGTGLIGLGGMARRKLKLST
jgi:hypothetical protein